MSNNGYQLSIIRGIPQNPTFDIEQFENLIDSFNTNDGDTFITTYVKAGTTWTQQIVHLLLRNGEPGGFYGETVPWLEAVCSPVLIEREAPTWSLTKFNSITSSRFFKSHATVQHLPRGKGNIRILYIARNPKDTAVSLFHHAKCKPEFGYQGNFDEFARLFLNGNVENGSWFDHVLGWHQECAAHPQNHLFLKYEDMYERPFQAVQQIAAFLGLSVSDEVCEKVVRHSQLREMQCSASIGMGHLRKGNFTVLLSQYLSSDIVEVERWS